MRRVFQQPILALALFALACGAPGVPEPSSEKSKVPAVATARASAAATESSRNAPPRPLPAGVELHREEVSDTPLKTQVNVDLLVGESSSETELRQLLEQVHVEVS